jgi:hypothetical protein
MHPELTVISAAHFQSVREFLLTDEYMPAIVENPKGEDVLPKRLGECTTVEHYRSEALRGAHLYVIAKRLAMKTMQDLVFRKITEAQYQEYGIKCLLNVAMVVFSRGKESVLIRKGKFKPERVDIEPGGRTDDEGDPLEEWLVQVLGSKLQPMMINYAQEFWDVANHGACSARGFGARVLRWKIELWDAAGPDAITIEDDD